jgi:hypothetical protein
MNISLWEEANIGIMNLLDISHFGSGKHINECVKKMLSQVHGGILWVDRLVPINVDIIETIIGIPMDGEKPKQYLEDKTKEKSISDEIKDKYVVERGNRGIRIIDINGPVTLFATRLLGCKLMHKCRKEEVPTGVVAVVTQCAKGISMSWDPYLLIHFYRTSRTHKTGALSSTIHGYSSSLHSWDGNNPHTICS